MKSYDWKYIFKKVLIFFIIFIILSFVRSCKVKAETYPLSYERLEVQFTDNTSTGIYWNEWYGTNNNLSVNKFTMTFEPTTDSNYNYYPIGAGTYLMDFYIQTNNLQTGLNGCSGISSDFRFQDTTTGNWISARSSSASTCIDSYYTTVNGNNAIHYLFQWQISDTATYPYNASLVRFIIYRDGGYIYSNGSYYLLFGSLQSYDSQIVTDFKKIANDNNNTQAIINNQNQNSQDEQNAINNQTSTITDDNVSGAESQVNDLLNNSAFQDNSGIQSIITAPLNFIQGLTNTCSPISLTIPFINSNVTIPCMKQELTNRVPTVVPILSTVINGFIIYRILIDIVGIVKSAREPDEDRIEVLDL